MSHPTDYPSFTVNSIPHHTMAKIADKVAWGPNPLPNPGQYWRIIDKNVRGLSYKMHEGRNDQALNEKMRMGWKPSNTWSRLHKLMKKRMGTGPSARLKCDISCRE